MAATLVPPPHSRSRTRVRGWMGVPLLLLAVFLLLSRSAAAQSALPHGIPDFSADTTKPHIRSAQSGLWSAPATWDLGRVPSSGDVVHVDHTVTIDHTAATAWTVAVHGKLVFKHDVNTRLLVVNLLVMHDATAGHMGELEIGTAAQPIAANVTAEVIFRDVPLNTGSIDPTTKQYIPPSSGVADPEQFGNGLIGLGKVTIHGRIKDPTFVRLATEPKAGDITLTLSQAVSGWQPGDRLIIPDSRRGGGPAPSQLERPTLQSVSPDGRTLTLASPLQFGHPGARNVQGVLEYLPHVGNLTRNVIFSSENSSGTRGHVLFTHMADVDVRYADFRGLGRTRAGGRNVTKFDAQGNVTQIGTNPKGRYAGPHLHHVVGPGALQPNGYRATLIGNAVQEGLKRFVWGIVIHDTDQALVSQNVVTDMAEGGIVTETGQENGNVIEKNFLVAIGGGSSFPQGRGDGALWFAGTDHFVRDNVVANGPQYQINYAWGGPFREVARNEVYGGNSAFNLWDINGPNSPQPNLSAPQSVVKDLVAWNNKAAVGSIGYPNLNVTFDHLVTRNSGPSYSFLAYRVGSGIIRNSDLEGNLLVPMSTRPTATFGLNKDGTFRVEDTVFWNSGIVINNISASTGHLPPRIVEIDNVKFNRTSGSTAGTIVLAPGGIDTTDTLQRDRIFVWNYNQIPGNNFQLFYREQHPNYIEWTGLTNQQAWDKYGVAFAGRIAPCFDTTSHPEIGGFVCPQDTDLDPPSDVGNLGVSFATDTSLTLTWDPATDNVGVVQHFVDVSTSSNFSAWSHVKIGNVTSHTVTGLSPNTTYYIRVKAVDGVPLLSPGSVVSVRTTAPGTSNAPPVVNAGPDQTILPWTKARLSGTVSDDGLPNPPGAVSLKWRQKSPNGVTTDIGDTSSITTFYLGPGVYLFTLIVNDGHMQASDSLTVTVASNTTPTAPAITTHPQNQTVTVGQAATFSVAATGTAPLVFQWQRNGAAITGATSSSYTTLATVLADSGSTFRSVVTNSAGSATSNAATLTVHPALPDVTPPTIASVGASHPTQVAVVFSEPVEQASAQAVANYAIDQGVGVTGAHLQADTKTVLLTTSTLSQGVSYTLTVHGVRDRASVPNVILPNSQKSFTFANVLGHWKLDNDALDAAGTSHGTLTNGATFSATVAPIAGTTHAVSLDGTDDLVDMGNVSPLSLERTAAFSYGGWIKSSGTGSQAILSKMDASGGSPTYRGYDVLLLPSNSPEKAGGIKAHLINAWSGNALAEYTNVGGYNDGNWHHVFVTYDGSSSSAGLKIYVDGVAVATTTAVNSLSATIQNTAPFRVGSRSGAAGAASEPFSGLLDDVRVYNRELSAAEVAALAARVGTPTPSPTPSTSPSPSASPSPSPSPSPSASPSASPSPSPSASPSPGALTITVLQPNPSQRTFTLGDLLPLLFHFFAPATDALRCLDVALDGVPLTADDQDSDPLQIPGFTLPRCS